MNSTFRLWLHGLGAALVGGAATGGSAALGTMAAGISVMSHQFWVIVGSSTIVSGLSSALAYLKQSPVPPEVK